MDRSVLELFHMIVQEPINLANAEKLADVINILTQNQRAQLLALLLCSSQGQASVGLMLEVNAALR